MVTDRVAQPKDVRCVVVLKERDVRVTIAHVGLISRRYMLSDSVVWSKVCTVLSYGRDGDDGGGGPNDHNPGCVDFVTIPNTMQWLFDCAVVALVMSIFCA